MTQQRSNDEIRYAIVGEWLVEETGECTCGTGGMDGYGHERGCGQEPVYKVAELLANYRAQVARAERAEAQVLAVREQAGRWQNTMAVGFYPEAAAAADATENCGDALIDLLDESGLSLQEEQPTHLVGAGGWRACDTAADWAGSDTTGVTCAECLATTTDVLQEEQE